MSEQANKANNLGEFVKAADHIANGFDRQFALRQYDFIRPHVQAMRDSVSSIFGHQRIFIGGEQSIMPLPKNFAKLIALRTLADLTGAVTINLRADHDLVGSEKDIRGVTLPHAGTQKGEIRVAPLGDNWRESKLTTAGVKLPDPKISSILAKAAKDYLSQAYTGGFNRNGKFQPAMDQQVLLDWLACYGIDINGNPIREIPNHMHQGPPNGLKLKQYQIQYPDNLAQAHENWYIWMQKQLGVEATYTISEGQIDPMLLRNGGIQVLQMIWKTSLQILRKNGYNPVSLKLDERAMSKTPFNIAHRGVRYESYFDSHDDTIIHAQNPVDREQTTLYLDDVLNPASDYQISLAAVPRVLLYSLAGLSGHITGGGSVYNYDAQQVLATLNLPYFPIWSFQTKFGGAKVSPVQYVTIANKATRGDKAKHDPYELHYSVGSDRFTTEEEQEVDAKTLNILRGGIQGRFGLLDLLISVDPQHAAQEIRSFIHRNGPNIRPETRVSITNKSDKLPPKLYA